MDRVNKDMETGFNEIKHNFLMINPFKAIKRITDFADERIDKYEKYQELSNGVAIIRSVVNKDDNSKKLMKMRYNGLKKFFAQQLAIYSISKLPSILNVVGYHIGKNKQDIYVEKVPECSLETILESGRNIGALKKLIIAFGIASAMKHLHKQRIVHRSLKPSVILLDSNDRPYLSEFYYARQIDMKYKYTLQEMTPEFAPPEFIEDYKNCQNSFKLDVYAFGITILKLALGRDPYKSMSEGEIIGYTMENGGPEIPKTLSSCWRDLIQKCCNKDPEKRPSFDEICQILVSSAFYASKNEAFKKYKELFDDLK